MVRCSICKEWYHTACANIDFFDWNKIQNGYEERDIWRRRGWGILREGREKRGEEGERRVEGEEGYRR